jgi:hypothetical protein
VKTVWKYELSVADLQTVELPFPHTIRKVRMHRDDTHVINLWVEADSDGPRTRRTFRIHGTGREVKGEEYIDTVFDDTYGFVWHVYADYPSLDELIRLKEAMIGSDQRELATNPVASSS